MYAYLPVRENLSSDEYGDYTAFGISVLKKTGGEYKEIEFISDVSLNLLKVLEIVYLCTKNRLEPIHIHDVIEDTL